MDLRPQGYYEFGQFLLCKQKFSSWLAMTTAAMDICEGFKALHAKGLSYQDLNDGNFFINPQTGRVLICDNDNADELKNNYGISYMRLFGSVAKNEHHDGSDVDIFVVMPPNAYSLCAAADYLESILGTNVDLIRKHSNMRPFFLNQISKYGIDIFGEA